MIQNRLSAICRPFYLSILILLSGVHSHSDAFQGCCGAQETEKSPRLRLDLYTKSAMESHPLAESQEPDKASEDLEQAFKNLSRTAAKAADLRSGLDPRMKIQIFENAILGSRVDLNSRNRFTQQPRPMVRYADLMNEASYLDAASTLIDAISKDDDKVPFVIDGTLDTDNEFPDCVAIGDSNQFFCTGSLIAPNLVVTAHHCDPDNISRIFIGLKVPAPFTPDNQINGHVYKVEKVHQPASIGGSPPNDIIVLQLEENVDPRHAKPRPVADEATLKKSKWGWVAGFGNSKFDIGTGTASGFGSRRKSPIPLIPGTMVSDTVASAFGCHFEFEFATGNFRGAASCFGDSGGPVYVKNDAGNWAVAGCVSRALPGDITGTELCGLGAVNTVVAKYPDLTTVTIDAPENDGSDENDGNTTDSTVTHALRVSHHNSMSISQSRVDEIMLDATTVLQTKDSPDDVACDVRLVRDGSVGEFSIGDGTIDTAFELNQVLSQPGWVKFVREINWCGGPGTSIIGCAPVPGTSLVVVRFSENQEGILLAHEFGHNKGLPHTSTPRAIMRDTIGPDHKELTAAECTALRQTSFTATRPSNFMTQENEPGNPSVVEFVQRRYVRGLPKAQASKYTSDSDRLKLLQMFYDDQYTEYRDNIVTVMGFSGGPEFVPPIIGYLNEGSGKLSSAEYRAKRAAIISLGLLAGKTTDTKALSYLKNAVEKPQSLSIQWTLPYSDSAAQRSERISTMAVWGLAMAGQTTTLKSLQGTSKKNNFNNQSQLLSEAVEFSTVVSSEGIINAFKRSSK